MADTLSFAAAGTKLKKGTGGVTTDWSTVTTWTDVGDVQSIGGLSFGRNMIDATHMTSPNDEDEYIDGRKTRGSISISGSFAPADATHAPSTGFIADRNNKVKRGYAIVFSDPALTTYKFNARVENYEITAQQAGKVDFSLSLRPTGSDQWSAGGT